MIALISIYSGPSMCQEILPLEAFLVPPAESLISLLWDPTDHSYLFSALITFCLVLLLLFRYASLFHFTKSLHILNALRNESEENLVLCHTNAHTLVSKQTLATQKQFSDVC